MELLGRDPGLGHVREELSSLAVLFWPVGPYLIVYRDREGQAQILAVIHGARDVRELLLQRLES